MKIPQDGLWKVVQKSEKGLNLLATRNVVMDRLGYVRLAERVMTYYDETNDADFGVPLAAYFDNGLDKLMTTGHIFNIDPTGEPTGSDDGGANVPTSLGFDSSAEMFNGSWAVSESADIHSFDGSAWTDQSVSLTSGVRHPMWNMKSNNTLCVGNGAAVKQFNTSYSETTNLALPAGQEVVAGAYNRNLNAILTWDDDGREAWFYIWDGATAAANYAYPIGSNRGYFVAPYKDTFVFLTGAGEILYWTPAGLEQLGVLPIFLTSALFGDDNSLNDVAFDKSVLVDGPRILFNISSEAASKNSEKYGFSPLMPAGIWCYDPDVGLYHRNAPGGAKIVSDTIPTTDVDISTNIITVGAAPAVGTEAIYFDFQSTSIPELVSGQRYFVIYVDATHIKLATSRANALAGTAIDLTGTGNSFQWLAFLPQSDFGQLESGNGAGLVCFNGPSTEDDLCDRFSLGGDFPSVVASTQISRIAMTLKVGENRGSITTQKIYASGKTEHWDKIIVKARNLVNPDDKIIVKYRCKEDASMPVASTTGTSAGEGTWTAADTFTTTVDLTAVKAAFDAGEAYEVGITVGAGSGYLAHILAISVNAGTWTVQIDESIRNISATNTMRFWIDNWLKLATATDGETSMTSASNPDGIEFPIDQDSKFIQFKIELRGRNVEIEELEIVNSTAEPAL